MFKQHRNKKLAGLFAALGVGVLATVPPSFADEAGLLGRWTFDESTADAKLENSARSDFSSVPNRPIPRCEGVFGGALDLSGAFALPIDSKILPADLQTTTVSAWVRPRNLSVYREILRKEDGDRRFLFSFQHDGTILSLGLNIAGAYVECDAPLSPSDVLDDTWRFVAATFDGQTMRVFLDGREIGSLEKPGALQVGANAPFMIGSSGGSGEFFDGGLDDLRLYSRSLSTDEIAALYNEGRQILDERDAAALAFVKSFYRKGSSFVETLADARRQLASDANLKTRFDRTAQGVFARLVRTDFPEDAEYFARRFQVGIGDYLTSPNNRMKEEAERVRDLYVEYLPLTADQWARLTHDETTRWRRVEEVAKAFDAALANPDAVDETRWFEFAFEMNREIQERPYQREAVAPYVKPSTPPVADLSPEEARAQLERDWLFQCDGAPTLERVRFELDRTAKLIENFQDDVDLTEETTRPRSRKLRRRRSRLLPARPNAQTKRLHEEPGRRLRLDSLRRFAVPARERMATRNAAPPRLHGGSGRTADDP